MGFVCDKCGECCRHLNASPIYAALDRGDGVCRYLVGNLCGIYETRPTLCRVDESYDALFKEIYTREDYDRLSSDACDMIKKMK